MNFLQVPLEIRLNAYFELFGHAVAYIDGGRQDTGEEAASPSMLPIPELSMARQQRSAQLLRTCKVILAEARPILYANTIFRTSFEAFAGRLPVQMTNGHLSLPHIKHLEWHLCCDLLKKYAFEDFQVTEQDVQQLQSIVVICQAEDWKGSFGRQWEDQQVLVKGRQQVIDFAKLLQSKMSADRRPVVLIESQRCLSRGRVLLRLSRRRATPSAGVSLALSEGSIGNEADKAQEVIVG